MQLLAKMSSWMGLDDSYEGAGDEVPRWNGVPRRTVALAQVAWVLAGMAVFAFLNSEMPDADGFGGYMPLIASVMFLALGITFTERLLLKSDAKGDVS